MVHDEFYAATELLGLGLEPLRLLQWHEHICIAMENEDRRLIGVDEINRR